MDLLQITPAIVRRCLFTMQEERNWKAATPGRRRWRYWQRDQAVLCLLAYTGIRRSELLALTWDDIRCDERTILVKGKGRKQRVLPVNSVLDATLWEYMKSQLPLAGKALFHNRECLPLKRGNLQDLFKRCVRHAGLDPGKVTLHKVRHTFATLLLGADTDIRTIQELLGHSEVGSTQVYAHTSPAQALKAVERLTKEEPDEERGRPT